MKNWIQTLYSHKHRLCKLLIQWEYQFDVVVAFVERFIRFWFMKLGNEVKSNLSLLIQISYRRALNFEFRGNIHNIHTSSIWNWKQVWFEIVNCITVHYNYIVKFSTQSLPSTNLRCAWQDTVSRFKRKIPGCNIINKCTVVTVQRTVVIVYYHESCKCSSR